jgi:hypothetical protein
MSVRAWLWPTDSVGHLCHHPYRPTPIRLLRNISTDIDAVRTCVLSDSSHVGDGLGVRRYLVSIWTTPPLDEGVRQLGRG